MLKEIKQYSNTLKEFINYLTESGVVLNEFYSKDIKFRIGFYIDFLDKHNITVMADCYNYAVYYDRETNESRKSVKYSVFVPILVKAIQEQQTQIENQNTLIQELTTRLTALENK